MDMKFYEGKYCPRQNVVLGENGFAAHGEVSLLLIWLASTNYPSLDDGRVSTAHTGRLGRSNTGTKVNVGTYRVTGV